MGNVCQHMGAVVIENPVLVSALNADFPAPKSITLKTNSTRLKAAPNCVAATRQLPHVRSNLCRTVDSPRLGNRHCWPNECPDQGCSAQGVTTAYAEDLEHPWILSGPRSHQINHKRRSGHRTMVIGHLDCSEIDASGARGAGHCSLVG